MKDMENKFNKNLRNPNQQLEFLGHFVEKSPLNAQTVQYAFGNEMVVFDPGVPDEKKYLIGDYEKYHNKVQYSREDIDGISKQFADLSLEVSELTGELADKIASTENSKHLGKAGLNVAEIAMDEGLRRKKENDLKSKKRRRDAQLVVNEKKKNNGTINITQSLQNIDLINDNYNNDSQVKEIKRQNTSDRFTLGVATGLAKYGVDELVNYQIRNLKNEYNQKARDLNPKITKLYETFHGLKK